MDSGAETAVGRWRALFERHSTVVWIAALVGLGLAAMPVLWLGSYGPTLHSGGDGAMYLSCAESLLAGEGYTYMGRPFTIRPPGFSVLLMPWVAAFGRDVTVLTAVGWFTAIAALVLLFLYQRERAGEAVAFAVCIVVGLNPFFLVAANQIMSDVPGLAALLGCLLLERWARRRPSLAKDLALGGCIALASYLRSIHVLLLPAVALAWGFGFVTGRPESAERGGARELPRFLARRALPVVVVALAVLAPWKVRDARAAPDGVEEYARLHSYSVALLHQDPADPGSPRITLGDLGERVKARSANLASSLGSRLVVSNDPTPKRVAIAVAGLLAWLVVLAVRRGAGDWFVGGVLFVVLIYFGFMDRLLLPVLLWVAPAVAWVLLRVGERLVGLRAARAVVFALLLAWAATDFDLNEPGQEAMEQDLRSFRGACAMIEREFPAGEALASSRAAHFALELERDVLNFDWPLIRGGTEGAIEFLDRHDVRGVVIARGRRTSVRMRKALGDRLEPIGAAGAYLVCRLRP